MGQGEGRTHWQDLWRKWTTLWGTTIQPIKEPQPLKLSITDNFPATHSPLSLKPAAKKAAEDKYRGATHDALLGRWAAISDHHTLPFRLP